MSEVINPQLFCTSYFLDATASPEAGPGGVSCIRDGIEDRVAWLISGKI
jgi:hypothetical protein